MSGLAPAAWVVIGAGAVLIGWLVRRAIDARQRRRRHVAPGDAALSRRIAEHVRARRRPADAWLTATALAALASGVFWMSAVPRDAGPGTGACVECETVSPPPAAGAASTATATAPPGPPATDPASIRMPTLLATLGGALLVVGGGALLVGLGRGPWAKGVGTAMVVSGLTANGYLVKELKLSELLKFEAHVDRLDFDLEFNRRIRALSEFGPQPLGTVEGFESGRDDIRPQMTGPLTEMCKAWTTHGGRSQRGVLLVIGSTDRVRLARATSGQYESNVGLARARAEQVKNWLMNCDVPSSQLVTLVSGPRHTPASASTIAPEDAAKDRSVVVWALWSVPTEKQ